MLDTQKVLTGEEEPLRVDNNQKTIDGFPVSYERKSYVQVPESEYSEDPIISKLIQNQEIPDNSRLSPWMLSEFQGLLALSKGMNKEMGLNYIQDTENRIYCDEDVRVGDQYAIGGGNLTPNFDFPPGHKQIISIHTHILETIKGTAGFSKYNGDGSDWDNILSRSSERIASIVLCRNGKGYIAIPKQSLGVTARQYFIANPDSTPDPVGSFVNQVYSQYEVRGNMNDEERVKENIEIAKAFKIDFFEADLKTGEIRKLA